MNTTAWLDAYFAEHDSFRKVWDSLDLVQVAILETAIMRAQADAHREAVRMTVKKIEQIRQEFA